MDRLWNVVLAAGSGRRLASVTGGTPKQFWRANGRRTLLEDTLHRSAPLASPARTVIVVDRTHAPFVQALPHLDDFDRVVFQPRDKGTAAGVLLGLTQVAAVAPEATLLLTPSDHGIADPGMFVGGVRDAAREVRAGRSEIVLFGVEPVTAEGDYGWITPAPAPPGEPGLATVAAFIEKPDPRVATRLLEAGAVWNTMVLVARAAALFDLYRRHLPALTDVFLQAMRLDAAPRETFLRAQYDTLSAADFSRDLLGRAEGLSLHTWPASMGWSDLGTPDRLERWHHGQFHSPDSSGVAARSPGVGLAAPQLVC